MGAATCHAHSDVPATASCRECFRPLCDVCAIIDGLVPHCGDCLRRERRTGRSIRSMIAVMALGALGAGAYLASRPEKPSGQVGTGDKAALADAGTGEQAVLSKAVDKEPCDRRKILELTELMLQDGDGRGALQRANAFLKKCGEYPRLRWITYESHMQLSEADLAVVEATKLIESSPYDADYHGWRGLAYEQKGDWAHAADDYRQALVFKPRLSDLPINLANMFERMGKPCDAIFPLEQVVYYNPDAQNIDALWARINDLAARGRCGERAGAGRAQIRIPSGERIVRVSARVEERQNGMFIVDTGASYATLTRAFAERLGLDLGHAPKVLLQTANGVQLGSVVTLEKIEVQGAKAMRVPAVVIDDLGRGIDGLLGLSFLSRFDLRQSASMLELSARRR